MTEPAREAAAAMVALCVENEVVFLKRFALLC